MVHQRIDYIIFNLSDDSLIYIERRRVVATHDIFAACLTAFLPWVYLGTVYVYIVA